jgi:hypothetical protein
MLISNLTFRQHSLGGIQILVEFPNHYGASIVGGQEGLYGDGVRTFEIGILHNDSLCYSTPISDDVLGYQTPQEVTEVLQSISQLPENSNCNHGRTK